ncbi:pre-rRNA-processing protein ESF1-like [Homarus americanus]|uniref:pre-rRNA-processing protein ESF1-like n=1 Tax=Homarus americanus TaxID=6706 RepID=UPI001C4640E3|nr:pre-rRNA-processing protein ESF1-like [Homarus americanus]
MTDKELETQPMSKKKQKDKKYRKGSNIKSDMDQILSDPRFAHISSDRKLRHVPKEERKIKLDSRFHSVLTDEKFYEKSTMDPRGRKGNYSTKEDLLKFYHMSSDEDSSDEADEDEEKDSNDDDDDDKVDENVQEDDNDDDVDDEVGEEEDSDDKVVVDEDEQNEENGEDIPTPAEERKGVTSDQNQIEEDNLLNEENRKEREAKERSEIPREVRRRLQDLNLDYARGEVLFSDDSSDDDSTTTDEDDYTEEFEWGELDQDAVWDNDDRDVEETSRIAVCNLDWDRIKAADIMVLFSSFCPRGGSIKRVTIYPSEYGKQRMVEENLTGPQELKSVPSSGTKDTDLNLVDLDKLEKGRLDENAGATKTHYEALRRYQRNRLRYFYAVVECNSIDTAKVLYQECDRKPYEGAGILLDLRYIPSDMTFDEMPHDVCEMVPKTYEVKNFTTTALHDSRPILTWDETDPERQKILSNAMSKAMKGGDLDDGCLKGFLASSSEEENEDSLDEEEDDDSDDEATKASRIAKFRALISEIDEKDKRKKEKDIDMEETFQLKEDTDEEEEPVVKESKTKEQLNPFEKYLEKRKTKRKERKKKKKEENENVNSSSEEESESKGVISDDELPEGVGDLYNDPFFADELKKMDASSSSSSKKKKTKKDSDETQGKEGNEQGDLELLLMDEDAENKKHFSMREIIETNKEKKKKRRQNKAQKKQQLKPQEQQAAIDDFKVNIADPRFVPLLTSGEYNIDPSHPQFKRTKAMDNLISTVQQKRMAQSFENVPEAKRQNTNSEKNKDHELSLLVKRVKSKTNKPKKKP